MNTAGPSLLTPGMTAAQRFCTDDVPVRERGDWWREVICRQYAHVDITSPVDAGFRSETTIFPWREIQLSRVRSSRISLRRLPGEAPRQAQDGYFAVLLLRGDYQLEQDGRQARLQPGDLALYDATRPHRIDCPSDFRKLIFAIPRAVLRGRMPAVEACTAQRIRGDAGAGAVASAFLRAVARQAGIMPASQFDALSEQALDLITMAATAVRPMAVQLSRSQAVSAYRVKACVDRHLGNSQLDAALVSREAGLTPRYVRRLFESQGTSLMRYVLQARLERCHAEIARRPATGLSITEIAFRWGFNDLSHFCRRFKERYGVPPGRL